MIDSFTGKQIAVVQLKHDQTLVMSFRLVVFLWSRIYSLFRVYSKMLIIAAYVLLLSFCATAFTDTAFDIAIYLYNSNYNYYKSIINYSL